LKQPAGGTATTLDGALELAGKLGYPVLVRPSYVLGGRAMGIVYTADDLKSFAAEAFAVSPEHPILIDKFLEDAIEVDVDAVSDGTNTNIGAVLEHVEEAGVHSGDAICVMPPHTLPESLVEEMKQQTRDMAKSLGVRGLINVQYAVRHGEIYVIEANPRASRTIPFVSKAIGIPLAKVATKCAMGMSLAEAGFPHEIDIDHVAVKVPVFPFDRFPGVHAALGPEMKSTGEVMGIDGTLGKAMAKALVAGGQRLPQAGGVFISVNDRDKRSAIPIARQMVDLGLELYSTAGTASVLARNDIPARTLARISEGKRPTVIDLMKDGAIGMLINTPSGYKPRRDEIRIRSEAIARGIPLISTIAGAQAAVDGIAALKRGSMGVQSLQEYAETARPRA